MQPGVFTGAGVDQAGQSHVRHFVLFPSYSSSSSFVRPATVEVGKRLVLGQRGGRGGGKQGVVDAESCQSSNSHGDSATTLRVASSIRPPIITLSALTGLTGVVGLPHPPADREHQWRR